MACSPRRSRYFVQRAKITFLYSDTHTLVDTHARARCCYFLQVIAQRGKVGQSPPVLDLCVKVCLISGAVSVSEAERSRWEHISSTSSQPSPPPAGHARGIYTRGGGGGGGWSSGCALAGSRLKSMAPFVFVFCGHFQADSETPIKMFLPPHECLRKRIRPGTTALVSEGRARAWLPSARLPLCQRLLVLQVQTACSKAVVDNPFKLRANVAALMGV